MIHTNNNSLEEKLFLLSIPTFIVHKKILLFSAVSKHTISQIRLFLKNKIKVNLTNLHQNILRLSTSQLTSKTSTETQYTLLIHSTYRNMKLMKLVKTYL